MSGKSAVFISYRRDDTADTAGRIYDRLTEAFGEKSVFKDVDAFPFGVDFAEYTMMRLRECRVALVLIGPHWLDVRDRTTNARRLDDPGDYVRIEIETALEAENVQVVPVLVSGAPMPTPAQLPASLGALCKLNAAQVRLDLDFSKNMNKLIQELREGVLTGTVVVEPVARAAAEIKWDELKSSASVEDILLFADSFPGTEQGCQAKIRANQLQKAASDFVGVTQLFISHATKDGHTAAFELTKALESHGIRCWIAPRNVKAGLPYSGQIAEAINQCSGLVVLLTPGANDSKHVLNEVGLADSTRKPIAPVFLDEIALAPNLNYFLSIIHAIHWTDASQTAEALIQSLALKPIN